MAKVKRTVGLSRDLIIHPGETLAEALEDRGMSQRELAIRTGMTEKHISTVVHGQKGISPAFARKLEYALGIEASFWMNLQANYDRELIQYEEINNISEEELNVLEKLKEVTEVWDSLGLIDDGSDPHGMVLKYRKAFGVSNLLDVVKLIPCEKLEAQSKRILADYYILYAWQRMCELLTKDIEIENELDVDKLRSKIPDIKSVMFSNADRIPKQLTSIFAECGITFRLVPDLVGAPVQGMIKRINTGSMILCESARQRFADEFWLDLFSAITHIIRGDVKSEYIAFDSDSKSQAEVISCDYLIDSAEYQAFIDTKGYNEQSEIKRFAESQNVKDYIVKGMLMNDKIIPWDDRPTYEWA